MPQSRNNKASVHEGVPHTELLQKLTQNLRQILFQLEMNPAGLPHFSFLNDPEAILEINRAELLIDPRKAFNCVHLSDRNDLERRFHEASDKFTQLLWEGRIISARSYKLKWLRLTAQPEQHASGNLCWHGVVEDITREKVLEAELRETRNKAEKETRSKENFLAIISHEIRTPLSGIVGMIELLMMDSDFEHKEQLGLLQFSANNLMALVNNLLDFSKINSGKMEVSESQIMLKRVLENLRHVHRHRALQNRNELMFNIDPRLPDIVVADEMVLMQILNNLLGNAIKFTKNGLVKLVITQEQRVGRLIYVKISVEDTGIGIASDQVRKIFKRFEQAEGTVNKHGGSGLGLFICKKMAQLLGSELEVESEAGKGSKFSFVMRFRLPADQPVLPTKSQSYQLPQPVKLLLVDDQRENRLMFQSFFTKWGQIDADEAANGQEALELIRKKDYDLVFMDLRMPVMDGWETCSEIRALKSPKSRVPVIALTADTFSTKKRDQFDDTLLKPFSPHEMLDMIIKYTQPLRNQS